MSTFSNNLYARWRMRGLPFPVLKEGDDAMPPEILVQAIWQHQRLQRDQLKTLDGRAVRVLHPGFKNHEAGPNFRGAVVQVGDEPPQSGDVEIDLRAGGWRAHGHDVNPAFKTVILHVVWETERGVAAGLPVLALNGKLDAPLHELSAWLSADSLRSLPESLQGKCCAPLRELPRESLIALLHQAAQVRWQAKAHQLAARARQSGWEQALWEGLFRALGYKQNVWPMQRLAELRPQWLAASREPMVFQSRLLGIGGLLPAELTRAQTATDGYLRRVWDQWWREREPFSDCILPRELWRFNNLRPANHPQRRLALAAHWVAEGDLPARLEKWFTATIPDDELADSLLKTMQAGRDDFWSWHWTLRSARLPRPQPLLGEARVTDLAINVVLPWFWMRAVEGKNERLQRVAEHRYLNWPAAEDNSLLKLARQRLLGGAKAAISKSAAAQQGLLQILRDFCDHSNALCDKCEFPELVRGFATSQN